MRRIKRESGRKEPSISEKTSGKEKKRSTADESDIAKYLEEISLTPLLTGHIEKKTKISQVIQKDLKEKEAKDT